MIKDSQGMDEMKNPCLVLKTHIFQVITFEEGTAFLNFQRIRQIRRRKIAKIEGLSTNSFKILGKRNELQGTTSVEGMIINRRHTEQ